MDPTLPPCDKTPNPEWPGAVLLAWGFSAFIAVEWLLVYLFATPPRLLAWIAVAAIVDIGLYWLVAHYMFENHEIEFSISCIMLPILVGALIPLFLRAQQAAKLRQQSEQHWQQSQIRTDDSAGTRHTMPAGKEAGRP